MHSIPTRNDHLSLEALASSGQRLSSGGPNGPGAGYACSPRAGSVRARTSLTTDSHIGLTLFPEGVSTSSVFSFPVVTSFVRFHKTWKQGSLDGEEGVKNIPVLRTQFDSRTQHVFHPAATCKCPSVFISEVVLGVIGWSAHSLVVLWTRVAPHRTALWHACTGQSSLCTSVHTTKKLKLSISSQMRVLLFLLC